MQEGLIKLVRRCESIETKEDVIRFEDMDGFTDLETWLSSIRETKLELLYGAKAEDIDHQAAEPNGLTSELLPEEVNDFPWSRHAVVPSLRSSSRSRVAARRLNL